MDYYITASELEPLPKVVLKFGSAHTYRGHGFRIGCRIWNASGSF